MRTNHTNKVRTNRNSMNYKVLMNKSRKDEAFEQSPQSTAFKLLGPVRYSHGQKYIFYLRKHIVIFQGDVDGGGSNNADYTDELAKCLKDWVGAEIDSKLDKAFWNEATEAHGSARTAVGNIYNMLNGTTMTNMKDPKDILEVCHHFYEDIETSRSKSFWASFPTVLYFNVCNMYLCLF